MKAKKPQPHSTALHHEVIVDLTQLVTNALNLQHYMHPAKICAVLKNNAYGHGLIHCARAIASTGIHDFGIVDNQEIEQIRNDQSPLLRNAVLWRIRPALPWEQEEADKNDWDVIEQIGSLDDLERALQSPADKKFVLTLDCSMGREGFGVPSHLDELVKAVKLLGASRIAGIMTHLANADGNRVALDYTRRELDDFDAAVAHIRPMIYDSCIVHVGNSAASLRLERVRKEYDMIRCGAGMFGEVTSPLVENPTELAPCLTWRTWIAQIREIPAGARIGYGSTYLATQDEKVATLPIGYADGLKKSLGHGAGEVLVRGVRCPIRGSISSASTVIGVSHISGLPLKPGEEVVIIGSQGEEYQGPDDVAFAAGTGHLDIQTGIRAPVKTLTS